MPREIVYNEDVRKKLQSGVDKVADTIKATLGPNGRYVVIQKPNVSPLETNDGATIAKEFELEDYAENMGAQLIKEVALKTNDAAGDGTTTATVLAQFIIREGLKNIASGANPMELKKGIQGATQLAAAAIRKLSIPVKTRQAIAQVGAVSAKDTDIGEMIADAMEKVGSDGIITVDESTKMDTTLTVMEGMQLERGYLSPQMITDKEKMVAELDNPYILITDQKITNPQTLVPLLNQIAERSRSLLIVAESVDGEALGMLVMNMMRGMLNAVAIHPPAYGDGRKARMDDLAVLTGGTFISEDMGYVLSETTIDMLGSATSVTVSKNNTIIAGGAGGKEEVETRIGYLRMLIDRAEYDFDRKQLEERLAKLISGVAVISVGGATEIEMKEKKLRIEDALNAARAAVAEGIIPGGGIAYIKTEPVIKAYVKTLSGDTKTGAEIILKALKEPTRQIAENAGMDGSAVIAQLMRHPTGIGFNAATGEYTNMMEAGIVDPAKVTRLALQSAASVSAVLMTTEAGITGVKELRPVLS